MALAITATRASPGPSSGTGTSSRCRLRWGSLSRVSSPSNIAVSSSCTVTPGYVEGRGRAAYAALVVSPARMASRICCISLMAVARRLHELDEHAPGVLGTARADPAPPPTASRLLLACG